MTRARICDVCGEIVTSRWYEVRYVDRGLAPGETSHDFCSTQCLSQYVTMVLRQEPKRG